MKIKLFFIFALAVWAASTPAGAQGKAQPDSLEIPAPFGTDVAELLKGRVAGVEVISSVASPGMTPTVYVRGASATSSSHPLYIVDGVRVHSLENLSPDDIESVEAVRDASALTLYGPEAADGVIVVKTRRAHRKGFHASFGVQGLVQWPAWYPEGITIEEANAFQEKFGSSPLLNHDCLTVSDGTERSFSHKHHLALQYGGDRVKAYTGLSYLDDDGPMRGQEGYRRYTGSWSLSWTPADWITVETTGNYGRGDKAMDKSYASYIWSTLLRSAVVDRSPVKNQGSLTRYYSTFLTGSAGVEVRPLSGLVIRAGGGYTRNGEREGHLSWYESDGKYDFTGRQDALDKWHWETEAGYAVTLGDGHRLNVGFSYRQRTEDYDLFSTRGSVPFSESGVSMGDAPAFIKEFLLPEIERFCSSGAKVTGHLEGVAPYVWTWKWSEMSAQLGYAWKDLVQVNGAYFRAIAPADAGKEPLKGWSVNGEWNLALTLRDILPAWMKGWALRGSWGQINRMLMSSVQRYFYGLIDHNEEITVITWPPYKEDKVHAVRRDVGMDCAIGEQGEFTLSATRFWNDDEGCMYFPSSFPVKSYSILNRGWEFAGGWKGTSGDFHYVVGGNLTLYSNRVRTPEGKYQGFNWGNLVAWDGYPVGVKRVFQFDWDHYSKENPNHYYQPYDETPSYEGGSMPTVSAGIRAMVGWKQLSLSVSGHGMGGNSIVANNFDSALRKYYNDTYPDSGYYLMSTTAALFDGSFFRIDQIRLDYVFRSNLRLYASLDNWFLFTRYPGSDPEMALHTTGFGCETASFPTSKRVMFGLEVGF